MSQTCLIIHIYCILQVAVLAPLALLLVPEARYARLNCRRTLNYNIMAYYMFPHSTYA